MTYRRAVLTVLLVTVGIVVLGAGPAYAHCHLFTVSAQPSTVSEGGRVTVTVSRDAAAPPSSVRVRTVPGSASNADFTPIDTRVSFTGSDVSKSLTLSTKQDAVAESSETVSLQLSDGQGCDVAFSYGSPAVVTIQNLAPTTTTTQPPTTTTSSTTTSSTSSTTSSTSSTTSSTTTTTAPSTSSSSTTEADSPDTTEAAAERTGLREEGGGSWMLPIALGGVTVVAFGGALFARHRLVGDEDVDEVDYDPDGEG